jgi:putative restriction endonuclease
LLLLHHTAYDLNLLGIDADGGIHVNRELLEIRDGPLTKTLQDTDGTRIATPPATAHRPNREFLAFRFEKFLKAA